MSSVASSSVGNMPPRHTKKQLADVQPVQLAEVMQGAIKENHKQAEELEGDKSDGGEELTPPPPSQEEPLPSEPAQPEIKQVQGYTMTAAVYPPQPCERCVRARKTCKGIAGARCEHCKSLHQKCSNSTGPPRGRHATGNTSRGGENGKKGSSAQARPKRKAANDKPKLVDDDGEEGDEDDEDDDDEKGQPARKKRRPAVEGRARILKDIAEVEGTIKRLQASFTKDLTKLQQTVTSLASQIREMDN